jgi:secreted PhoX family phosphatase
MMDRRKFLGAAAGALFAPSLEGLVARAHAAEARRVRGMVAGPGQGGYGPLVNAGRHLALPAGFAYEVMGVEGTPMSNGQPTPRAHDGMAAFALRNGNVRLVRNHEVAEPTATSRPIGDPARAYDRLGPGGTTSLEVRVKRDGSRELVRDFVSLGGTLINCAGGPTPWGSWLTCEETVQGTGPAQRGKDHGYVFEVDAHAEEQVEAVPLKAMGRFVHEAVAVDPRTGIVYETEDRATGGFYRFIPKVRGKLREGGRLQMLAVRGRPQFDTRTGQTQRVWMPVEWVGIADPDPAGAEADALSVYNQGVALGAATFARLEGCFYGHDSIFFHATNGGDRALGQVWQYRPGPGPDEGRLQLLFESTAREVLDQPDNLTVSPRGGIVICEDADQVCHLRGLTPDGRIFDFARNILNDNEFAGACFSPDGRTLFVNCQGDIRSGQTGKLGRTYAIWGPWERGAL